MTGGERDLAFRSKAELRQRPLRPPAGGAPGWLRDHQHTGRSQQPGRTLGRHRRGPEGAGDDGREAPTELLVVSGDLGARRHHRDPRPQAAGLHRLDQPAGPTFAPVEECEAELGERVCQHQARYPAA